MHKFTINTLRILVTLFDLNSNQYGDTDTHLVQARAVFQRTEVAEEGMGFEVV